LDDSNDYTFEDSDDWDKPGSIFGLGGIRRTVIQLFGQLDRNELHWGRQAKRQEMRRRLMSSLVQPFDVLRPHLTLRFYLSHRSNNWS